MLIFENKGFTFFVALSRRRLLPMIDSIAIPSRILSMASLLLLGLCSPVAWSAEPPQLQVPMTVVSPGENVLPQIESLIEILPASAVHPEVHLREQNAAHIEREIGEIETTMKEAAEESQELQEEIREIDDD